MGLVSGATARAVSGDVTADTFPKLMLENARRFAARPAAREKDLGIWQTWTWAEVAEETRAMALGLAARGLKRGDRLGIIGDNRPRLYWSMCAAQMLGAVPVPVYQDAVADEVGYVLDHAEVAIVIAEDQEQVDKLIQMKERCATLQKVVVDDARGMRTYDIPWLENLADVIADGRSRDASEAGSLDEIIAAGHSDDTSIILYTSGTTGRPKGVVLTHHAVMTTARNTAAREGLGPNEDILAYLPMAWVGDHIFSFGQWLVCGFCVNCPESADTVMNDLWEVGPTYFFAPPRIFENVLTTVTIRMEDAGRLKHWMFDRGMKVARRVGAKRLDGKPVGLLDRIRYRLADLFVIGPLKNALGLSRVRLAYTAGEAIGPELFAFYRALGINLKQLYGMTEASVFVTVQPDGEVRNDTVGIPAPEVELKIADNGEVLFRSPGVFTAYFKNDEATAEAKTADGWVHTGDAGFVGDDGHLRIIDRAKDVGKLSDGSLFAPKFLENKLKFYPHIKEAVAFGDGRDHACAIINIDLEAVGNWAERRSIAYASYTELAARPEVYDLIADAIAQVNRDLAADPQTARSQIVRFLILHKELDADDGELTRTRKVRRNVVNDRYAQLIDALYSDAASCQVEAQVTFEDGRTGTIRADLAIRDVATVAADAHAGEPMKLAG